jgi:hypothetical protein
MARVNDRGLPWFAVRALERSAGGRYSAGDIYPDLDAEPGAQRRALQRRQRVDSEIANLGRLVRDGVPDEDAPRSRAQPRGQSMSEIARNIYPDLNNAAAEQYAQWYAKWEEAIMKPWGFERVGRAPREHPDWWAARKGK